MGPLSLVAIWWSGELPIKEGVNNIHDFRLSSFFQDASLWKVDEENEAIVCFHTVLESVQIDAAHKGHNWETQWWS